DHCLGDYFRKAKKEAWYSNTLFIIVADHSHNSYRNWHPQSREYHKIPLLFYGDVIKEEFRGKKWMHIGNQNDIAATLLAQLGLKHTQYRWSKDLFNPAVTDFAFFASEDGGGWIRKNGYFSFDAGTNYFHFLQVDPSEQDTILTEGKAYLQVLFKDYLGE
ncbi:MAG: sulfatase-like hydrolase/transferase, partial [Syntrophothermus sp.]